MGRIDKQPPKCEAVLAVFRESRAGTRCVINPKKSKFLDRVDDSIGNVNIVAVRTAP